MKEQKDKETKIQKDNKIRMTIRQKDENTEKGFQYCDVPTFLHSCNSCKVP